MDKASNRQPIGQKAWLGQSEPLRVIEIHGLNPSISITLQKNKCLR